MKHLDTVDIASIVVNDSDIDRIAVMVLHAYHPELCSLPIDTHKIARVRNAYVLAATCLAAKDELISSALTAQAAK